MFIDETILECRAGKGGDGVRSFRREKFAPKGGPDGGNGGRGGHVILKAFHQLHTLFDIENRRFVKAGNGQPGGPSRSAGKCGSDRILKVPVGTLIKDIDTGSIIYDLCTDGATFTVAQGGKGGKGNFYYKSSVNQAPERFTEGKPGQTLKVRLELKLMADCGLVGLPNAGKSSLLNRMSNARPKIADYAFTTLQPYLGIVAAADGRHFVMADIPGIIEGAAAGKGLGNQFLRHIERTACLAFVLDLSLENPWEDYRHLLHELKTYQPEMLKKPRLVLLNKTDLGELPVDPRFKKEKCPVLKVSAVTGAGLDAFCREALALIHEHSPLRSESW